MLIITLLLQALFVPVLLSGLAIGLCSRFLPYRREHHTIALLLTWLLTYAWIVNIPNFPPRMATDWLWVIVIALLIENFLSRFKISSMYGLTILLLVSIGILSWPILSYHPSLLKHGGLWLELIFFTIISCLIVNKSKTNTNAYQPLGFIVLSGITGALTLASGSMLLGLLSLSLASSHFLPAVFKTLAPIKNTSFFAFMALILLLLSRQFAELNGVTFFALLLANLVVINTILPQKITLSIYGALIVLSIGSVAQQEFFIVNTPYFGE